MNTRLFESENGKVIIDFEKVAAVELLFVMKAMIEIPHGTTFIFSAGGQLDCPGVNYHRAREAFTQWIDSHNV